MYRIVDTETGELDKESLPRLAKEIDLESFSLELQEIVKSPQFYLKQVVRLRQKRIREELDNFDLTDTQYSLLISLMVLTKDQKIVVQSDLVQFFKADKMMVSDALKAIEAKGYIVRENHPTDRRAKSLILTKKGIDFLEATLKYQVQFNKRFFSPLGDETDDFIRLLKKLL
jgi:DNA-binding MarR family transcriptional regulator